MVPACAQDEWSSIIKEVMRTCVWPTASSEVRVDKIKLLDSKAKQERDLAA